MSQPFKEKQLYDFLEMLKTLGVVSVRDLTSEGIQLAEELVSMGLLTKTSTRVETFYTYGINGFGGQNG